MKEVTVKQRENAPPIPTEVIADEIRAISQGIKKLRDGRLSERALIVLITHATPTVGYAKVSGKTVKAVLEGMESLERVYLKKPNANT